MLLQITKSSEHKKKGVEYFELCLFDPENGMKRTSIGKFVSTEGTLASLQKAFCPNASGVVSIDGLEVVND